MFIARKANITPAPFGGAERIWTRTSPVEFRSSERRMVFVKFYSRNISLLRSEAPRSKLL